MSTNWHPDDDESEGWKSSPADSSFPSFPFIDRDVPPAEPENFAISAPPPPPSSLPSEIMYQNERPTTPRARVTFLSIGAIAGIVITVVVLLGVAWIIGARTLGFGVPAGRSSVTNGGSFGKSHGGSTSPGGSGGGSTTPGGGGGSSTATPGTTGTAAVTPGVTPTTGPGPTATPSMLPLMVEAQARDHTTARMRIRTLAGATLTITITYCDGSKDSKYNDYSTVTATGTYTDTLTLVRCMGQGTYLGTVAVAAHLDGYQDAMASVTMRPGG
jgi:hypothetical protein